MTHLASQGLAVDLPAGWDGRIGRRLSPSATGIARHTVMHLANFALPEERGDFGSGAVDIMGPGGVIVVLFEHDPLSAGTALFRAEGIPRRLRPEQFGRNQLQRAMRGQVGAQFFGHEHGRAFCLYVVLGSSRLRRPLAALADGVQASLEVSPASASMPFRPRFLS